DPGKFMRILQSRLTLLMLPIYSIALLLPLAIAGRRFIPPMRIAGLPAIDAAGFGTRHPGFGIGIIALGGAGIGIVGIGGLGAGVIGIGGGAIGIIAIGGGAFGIIAI